MAEMIDNAYSIGEEAGRSSDLPKKKKKLEIAHGGLRGIEVLHSKGRSAEEYDASNPKESIDFNDFALATFIQYTMRIRSLEAKRQRYPVPTPRTTTLN